MRILWEYCFHFSGFLLGFCGKFSKSNLNSGEIPWESQVRILVGTLRLQWEGLNGNPGIPVGIVKWKWTLMTIVIFNTKRGFCLVPILLNIKWIENFPF